MRELGLGITNDDVRKIDVGEIEKNQSPQEQGMPCSCGAGSK
ncbi:MAG: hypothetical protein V1825_00810 [Candidatus Falkowbacteria bacterium]